MKRIAVLCCSALMLAGAAGLVQAGDAGHCRVYPASDSLAKHRSAGQVFNIHATTLAGLASLTDQDYELVSNRPANAGARITLAQGDRVQLIADTQGLLLEHTRNGAPVGTAVLQLDAWGLWAVGDAYDASDERVGYYYVYRLDDVTSCGHSDPVLLPGGGVAPCRSVRIEFFDDADRSVDGHHPVQLRGHPAQNVFPADAPQCTPAGLKQTDEGDGDEGRRR
jgi:hypothetical protein